MKLGKNDNVVTVTKDTPAKTVVNVDSDQITVLQDIPFDHKFALENIEKGGDIVKYGVKIGVASQEIKKGEYVHIHNVSEASLEIRDEMKRQSLGARL